MKTKGYIFVIDTDSYSGNFEREMCAYITGVVGDCGVGREFTKIYREETKDKHEDGSQFCELLEQRSNENGCCRPCSVYPDKREVYNSVAIYFYDKPTKDIIELMKKRAFLFSDAAKIVAKKRGYNESSPGINVIGFRLIQELEDKKEIKI